MSLKTISLKQMGLNRFSSGAVVLFVGLAQVAAQDPTPKPAPAVRHYLETPRFHWQCEDSGDFRFCYQAGQHLFLGSFAPFAQRALDKTLQLIGAREYKQLVCVFLLGSYADVQTLTGAYGAGASQPQDHVVVAVVTEPDAFTHELNHEVTTNLWGPSEPWIAEGLAAYVATPGLLDVDSRRLYHDNKAIPLDRMVNPDWNASQYPSTVIYPELGSFVKFLKQKYGIDAVHRVWKGGSHAIPRIFGSTLVELESAWRESIGAGK